MHIPSHVNLLYIDHVLAMLLCPVPPKSCCTMRVYLWSYRSYRSYGVIRRNVGISYHEVLHILGVCVF